MSDSLAVNYILIRVSKAIRDTQSDSNVSLINDQLVNSAKTFIVNTWFPLYSNAYANSVITISSFRY